MGVNVMTGSGMDNDKYTITSKMNTNILSALSVGSTRFSEMYGAGRYHQIIKVVFKVPVVLDGFSFVMTGSTLGENRYYLNGSFQSTISTSTSFAPTKVRSIEIERYIKDGYSGIDYNITISDLRIRGAYELHLLEIDNKLFTTNGSTVTFVSDNLEPTTSIFMSSGFTTDKLNPTIIKKLAELTKKYKVCTLKL